LYGDAHNAIPAVAAAVDSGDMTLGQAAEIAASTRLMDPSMVAEIETDLVELARRVEPGQISKAAERIKAEQLRERKAADEAAATAAAAHSEAERRAEREREAAPVGRSSTAATSNAATSAA
jgi:hypothetical protein